MGNGPQTEPQNDLGTVTDAEAPPEAEERSLRVLGPQRAARPRMKLLIRPPLIGGVYGFP